MAAWVADVQAALARREEPLVPDLAHWRRRAAWRAAERARLGTGLARAEAALPPMSCDTPLSAVA